MRLITTLLGGTSVRLAGALLSFAVVIILARVLGPTEFGVYAYVLALISLLAVPMQSGLPTLVIRETARAQQRGDWGGLFGLWRWSLFIVVGLALLVGLAVIVCALLFSHRIAEPRIAVFLWGLALLPLMALNSLHGAALTGLRKVVQGQLPETLLRPGILLGILLGGVVWSPAFQPNALEVMVLAVLAGGLSLIIAAYMVHIKRPGELASVYPSYRHRAWFSAMWPLALIDGLQVINSHIDILMLGLLATVGEVGVYRVVVQGAGLVVFALQIVNMTIAPQVARLHAAGETERLQQMVTRSARLTLLGALPVVLVLVVFGRSTLDLVFGLEYAAGYAALAILAIGQLINAAMGSVGLLLNMTGHERETARGVAIAVALNAPLNLALIPWLGMDGAALATAISLLVWNLLLWRAVRRHLGLNSTAFSLGYWARSI